MQSAFSDDARRAGQDKSFLPQSVLAQLNRQSDDADGVLSSAHNDLSETNSAAQDQRSRRSHTSSIPTGDSSALTSPTLNTAVRLSNRKVTILCMNVLGYHRRVLHWSENETVRQHGQIVKMVSDVCGEHRGVMDGFQGDRFTVSFNAVTTVSNHSTMGVRTALAAGEGLRERMSLAVSSGVASGAALVGNIGSATTKRFAVLSSVVSSAVLLERLSKRYGEGAMPLVGGSALEEVQMMFEALTVDAVMLPSGGVVKRSRVCTVMGAREAAADEWMYEMQEGQKNSVYASVNEAFGMYLGGLVCEAEVSVRSQLVAADGSSVAVRGVLRYLDELVRQANCAGDAVAVSEYGQTYTNPLSDFYSRCALPYEDQNRAYGECTLTVL